MQLNTPCPFFYFVHSQVIGIRRILQDDLRQKIVEMKEDQKATLDGGDVLFTGKE